MKKYIYIILLLLSTCSVFGQIKRPPIPGYVDLDLPSGTFWKDSNESGYYQYNDAVRQFGNSLPTREQAYELQRYCTWKWNGYGYTITGRNGNSIFLPALGYRNCEGNIWGVNEYGDYMYYDPNQTKYVVGFSFTPTGQGGYMSRPCNAISVRLVK